MSYVTTKDGTQIFYKDWGPKDAQPIVFHHGWPLSSDDWDIQMLFFLANGYRVVAHDRVDRLRQLQHDESLEHVFVKLAVHHDVHAAARSMIEAVRG